MEDKIIRTATVYCYWLMSLYGVSIVMIGTLVPELLQYFEVSLSEIGFLMTIQCFGGILALFLGSRFAEKVKKSLIIPIAFGALVLGLLIVGYSPSFLVLQSTFLITGFFIRIADIFLNAFVGQIHQEESGIYLNRLHMFFSIGAFTGPFYSGMLIKLDFHWEQIYSIIGILFVLSALLGYWFIVPIGRIQQTQALEQSPFEILRNYSRSQDLDSWCNAIVLLFPSAIRHRLVTLLHGGLARSIQGDGESSYFPIVVGVHFRAVFCFHDCEKPGSS